MVPRCTTWAVHVDVPYTVCGWQQHGLCISYCGFKDVALHVSQALQGGPLTTCRLWLRPDCRTLVVPGRLAARHVFGPVVARVVQLAAGVAAEGAEGGRPPNKVDAWHRRRG